MDYKERAERLWSIIDDISTYSDMIKPTNKKGYKKFYKAVMKKQLERSKYLISKDGYTLVIPSEDELENINDYLKEVK